MISKYCLLTVGVLLSSLGLALPASSAFANQSEGLTITPTHVQSPFDKVPRFCNPPHIPAQSLITNIKTGAWSDPTTWSTQQVPGNNATVQIAPQTTVTYDVASDTPLECIEVQGKLLFSPDHTTKLVIRELMVMPEGTLTIGTQQTPIRAAHPATIIFRDAPLRTGTPGSPGIDPQMYGNGLIVFGNVTMHGEEKDPTFVRLAQEPKAGDITLTLFAAPAGWLAGDEVFLPDTRLNNIKETTSTQRERHTIASVSGSTVTLTQPLAFLHECARDADIAKTITTLDSGEPLCPHLGNLSRTITLQSQNPAGVRGHTIYLHRAEVNLQYARFKDLGRTLGIKLDSSTFDASGNLTKVGTNQIGKYSLHLHHVWGARNEENTGYQGVVIGNAIDGGLKWLFTIHDTHYFHIAHNVVYDGVGAGIVAEDGSETLNLIEHNFAAGLVGGTPTDPADGVPASSEGLNGDPFWVAGTKSMYLYNVGADGNETGFGHWNGGVVLNENFPLARGVDNRNWDKPATEAGRSSGREGYVRFVGNEVYSVANGIELRNAKRSWLEDIRAWQISGNSKHPGTGIFIYDNPFDKFWIKGAIIRTNPAQRSPSARGIFNNGVLKEYFYNVDIQGMRTGILHEKGSFDLENSYFSNDKDITRALKSNNQLVTVHNTTFSKPPYYVVPGDPHDAVRFRNVYDTSLVTKMLFDNVNSSGIKQQVFALFQDPNFAPSTVNSTTPICGNDPSLTNQQCLDQFQTSILGEVATCRDITLSPSREGSFVCPYNEAIALGSPMLEIMKLDTQNNPLPATSTELYYRHFSVPAHNVGSLKWQLNNGTLQTDTTMEGKIELANLPPGSHTVTAFLADSNGAEIPNTKTTHSFTMVQPVFNTPPSITGLENTYTVSIDTPLQITITATDAEGDDLALSIPNLETILPGAVVE